MQRWVFSFIVATIVLAARPAFASGVDCLAQKTAEGRTGCTAVAASVAAVADLGSVSAKMERALAAELAGVSAPTAAQITIDQTEWVTWLAAVCKATDEQTPEKLALCLQQPFEDRQKLLAGSRQLVSGITFVTRTRSLAFENTDTDTPDGEYPDFGTLRAAWPMADSDTPEWQVWNAGVEAEARRVVAPDRAMLSEWSPTWAEDRDATLEAPVESVGQGRVRVHMEHDTFGHGAAHPIELSSYFTWMLPEKREIAETDIFAPGTDWEKIVQADCLLELKEQFGGKLDEDALEANVDEIARSPKSWVVTPQGFGVSFAARTVGQKIVVVAIVVVPWPELKKSIAAGFATGPSAAK